MDTVTSADGTTIAYDRVGEGPALVIVTGAFSDRAATATLAGTLADEFAVYAYDRRGRGSSGDTTPYAVEREIEDLDALIAAAGGSAFVFGHSSGATLALEAAAHGLPIAKVVAYEPPYIVDDSRARPVNLDGRMNELLASGRRSDAMKLFLIEAVELPAEVVATMESSPAWAQMEALAPTLSYDIAICPDNRMPAERLATIQVPTLVLSGGDSREWARNAAAAAAEVIPEAEHRSLAGQTHGAADDVLAPVLREFFSA